MKIGQKLLLIIASALFCFLATNLVLVLIQTDKLTNAIIKLNLTSQLEAAINATDLYIKDFYNGIKLENGVLIGNNGKKIEGDFTFVDLLQRELSTTATIFKKENNDFTRMTTNILQADGTRAVGTKLGPASAAYEPTMAGKLYIGEAEILGLPYYTAYNPLFSNKGEVIGIMYLGISKAEVLNETKSMNAITQQISDGMNEMATGAQQIIVAVEEVNQLSTQNNTSIGNLTHEINKFKI